MQSLGRMDIDSADALRSSGGTPRTCGRATRPDGTTKQGGRSRPGSPIRWLPARRSGGHLCTDEAPGRWERRASGRADTAEAGRRGLEQADAAPFTGPAAGVRPPYGDPARRLATAIGGGEWGAAPQASLDEALRGRDHDRARALLRARICGNLAEQGFGLGDKGLTAAGGSGKDGLRKLHADAVARQVARSRPGLVHHEGRLVRRLAAGPDVDPERMRVAVRPVMPGTEDERLFRWVRLHWSVPTSPGYGRRLRFLVTDEHNGALVGVIGLGDPVFALRPRDEWIGWDRERRRSALRHVLDAFVVGAVPPYSHLLAGKLVAALLANRKSPRPSRRSTAIGRPSCRGGPAPSSRSSRPPARLAARRSTTASFWTGGLSCTGSARLWAAAICLSQPSSTTTSASTPGCSLHAHRQARRVGHRLQEPPGGRPAGPARPRPSCPDVPRGQSRALRLPDRSADPRVPQRRRRDARDVGAVGSGDWLGRAATVDAAPGVGERSLGAFRPASVAVVAPCGVSQALVLSGRARFRMLMAGPGAPAACLSGRPPVPLADTSSGPRRRSRTTTEQDGMGLE